jgi:hypothetical protein
LRIKEKKSGSLLYFALSLKRYREKSAIQTLRPSEAFYLPAVNSKARIKWGTVFIREIFKFFGVTDDENGPATLALLWQILGGAGFPNQFFCDSWVVGFWRAGHG